MPYIWYVMLKASGLPVLKLNLPIVVLGFIVLQQYIGIPILYFQLDDYRALFVTDKNLVFEVFIYTSLCISLIITGLFAGRYYFGELKGLDSESSQYLPLRAFQRTNLLFIGGFCVLILLVYVQSIGIYNLAIASVLGFGDEVDLAVARSQMGNAFQGKYHWFKLFFRDILLFIILIAFAEFQFFKTRFTRIFLFVFIPILLFSVIMATEKAPLVDLLITFWVAIMIIKNKGKVYLGKLIRFGLIIISSLMVMYILFMGSADIVSSIASLFSRALTGQIQPAYHYIEMFPEHEDWLMGRSFPNPRGILPFEIYDLSKEVMHFVHPQLREMGITGSMPTIFWSELYANFNFIGVIIGSFLVGFLLYLGNYILFTLRFNSVSIALYVYVIMHYKSLAMTSLSNFMLDIYILFVCLIGLVIMRVDWLSIGYKSRASYRNE